MRSWRGRSMTFNLSGRGGRPHRRVCGRPIGRPRVRGAARLSSALRTRADPATRILEVGAGAGVVAGFLSQQGADLLAIEPAATGFEHLGAVRALLAERVPMPPIEPLAADQLDGKTARPLWAHLLGQRARAHAATPAEPRRTCQCACTGRTHDPHVPELPCAIRAAPRDPVGSREASDHATHRSTSIPGPGLGVTQLDHRWRRHAIREKTWLRAAVSTRSVSERPRPSAVRRSLRPTPGWADRHCAPFSRDDRAHSSSRPPATSVDDADVIHSQQTGVLALAVLAQARSDLVSG